MRCSACNADVPAGKFCSNCGGTLRVEAEPRRYDQVDIEWIAAVLKRSDFEVEIGKPGTDGGKPTTLLARHRTHPNFMVDLRPTVRYVMFTSYWTVKPPGMLDKGDFFKAVNAANLDTICVQCSVAENDLTTVSVQLGLFLTESMTEVDLAEFVEIASKLVRRAIESDRLKKYM